MIIIIALDGFSEELQCVICLDSFKHPIELKPCGHILCSECARPLNNCPQCRQSISGRAQPNRVVLNMANSVKVKCQTCGWTGTREESYRHTSCAPANNSHVSIPVRPQVIQPPDNHSRPWEFYNLSQIEYDQICAIFIQFDADDSGSLDRRELAKLAHWLNYARTDQDIECIFNAMDTDHNGTLSLTEFCTWLKYNKPDPQALYGLSQYDYNTVLMQFHQYDKDNRGELNITQFTNMCLTSYIVNTPEQAADLFRQIDFNRSGSIDLHEFLVYQARKRGIVIQRPYHLVANNTPGGSNPAVGNTGHSISEYSMPPQNFQSQQYNPNFSCPNSSGYSSTVNCPNNAPPTFPQQTQSYNPNNAGYGYGQNNSNYPVSYNNQSNMGSGGYGSSHNSEKNDCSVM